MQGYRVSHLIITPRNLEMRAGFLAFWDASPLLDERGGNLDNFELKPLDYFCAHTSPILRLYVINWNDATLPRGHTESYIPEVFTSTLISCGADGCMYLRSFSDLRTGFLLASAKGNK